MGINSILPTQLVHATNSASFFNQVLTSLKVSVAFVAVMDRTVPPNLPRRQAVFGSSDHPLNLPMARNCIGKSAKCSCLSQMIRCHLYHIFGNHSHNQSRGANRNILGTCTRSASSKVLAGEDPEYLRAREALPTWWSYHGIPKKSMALATRHGLQ